MCEQQSQQQFQSWYCQRAKWCNFDLETTKLNDLKPLIFFLSTEWLHRPQWRHQNASYTVVRCVNFDSGKVASGKCQDMAMAQLLEKLFPSCQ